MKNKEKMAFLILAHNDPPMLKKLVYALDDCRFDIYIHVDAKVDIKKFDFDTYSLSNSDFFVVSNREKVYWGDYSIVRATLIMYEQAYNHYPYIRYVTLSGNDYPLKSNDEIFETLSNQSVEFIMGTPNEKPEKVENYYFKKSGLFGRGLTHLFACLHIKRNNKPFVIDGKRYTIYFAPQWHALSGECVKEMLEIINKNREYIEEYLKYSFASDELLIPTLVFNGRFRNHTLRKSFPKGTHYNQMPAIHCIDYEPIVRVFNINDKDFLVGSGKLFARKLRSGDSDELICAIDWQKH